MDTEFLEQYYQKVILPLYKDEINLTDITWKDHGKVGLDAWAHYFDDSTGREYVLLYEDFPGEDYLSDDLTHELVKCGSEPSLQTSLSDESKIDNIIGYFTLYREKR